MVNMIECMSDKMDELKKQNSVETNKGKEGATMTDEDRLKSNQRGYTSIKNYYD